MTDPPGDDAAELARQYERVAAGWSRVVTGTVGPVDAPAANRLLDQHAIAETAAPVVAVTPVVSGGPIEDPGNADEVASDGLEPIVAPTLVRVDKAAAAGAVAGNLPGAA